MAKEKKLSRSEKEKLKVQSVTAAHLVARDCPCTKKERLEMLFEKVKVFLGDESLTVQKFLLYLEEWFRKGWATLAEGILQVTRAGRKEITSLAEQATAPPEPIAT